MTCFLCPLQKIQKVNANWASQKNFNIISNLPQVLPWCTFDKVIFLPLRGIDDIHGGSGPCWGQSVRMLSSVE